MEELITQWGSLLGFAALVAAFINVLKYFKVVKDGDAGKWSAGFNLLGIVVLFALKIFAPEFDLATYDETAGQVAQALLVMFGYGIQLFGSKLFHDLLKGMKLPLFSKSLSAE